jgi:hypothetical protein
MLRLAKETLWKLVGGIVSSALLLIANAMGYHPDRWLAQMILGTISDPETLLALKWGSVAIAAIVGGAVGHVVLGILERRTAAQSHNSDASFTPMPAAVQRIYEALRERKGPSLETVEHRAREEFGGSTPIACATGMLRHLTIYGEPRPSMVREPPIRRGQRDPWLSACRSRAGPLDRSPNLAGKLPRRKPGANANGALAGF